MPIGPGYRWAARTRLGSGRFWSWLSPEQTQLLKYPAALKAQVPRRPQVPRRRVNNFQLANVMEPQSSPPARPPTPAPAPGSDADILVDDSVSNAPATRPVSVAATSAMTDSQETEESSSVATSKKRKLTSQTELQKRFAITAKHSLQEHHQPEQRT
ncbi:hypothetical protein PCASD_08671 [Puccinia coronata f. sp. avenae]|uniref:Uncharacterized protein n=1 Tax=Puccinia coronata f. sp. avenae TaxID=200324 RepID=A0A2N5V7F5_9BASI|nr:hypothetical protein PCASD_08671 [Puccinia coronata f. sp. avenae]